MDKVFDLIKQEEQRQQDTITLIPSENYASAAVLKAQGSVLNNKYSEGYPGKRYYQGNRIIDEIEQLAIDRAKNLFGVAFANVQPYSGSPMNLEVLLALIKPGDTIMGMEMGSGGHLTHGAAVSMTGKLFRPVQFGTDEKGLIDYEEVESLAKKEQPKLLLIGTTAYSRLFDWNKFKKIAESAGAYLVADISHIAGLIAGGAIPSPVEYADVITTTTHKTLRGPRGAMILSKDEQIAKKIDRAVFPGMQGGPHENVIAAIAMALEEASRPEFKGYAAQVIKNAKTLADELQKGGLEVLTGGTDNHLMLVDLRPLGLSGKQTAINLEEAGIVTNYNTVPRDTASPMDPSGIRLGTPAATTRGMKEEEMKKIANCIVQIVKNKAAAHDFREEIRSLCERYPVPN